ncbi:SpoIIIAH-like family protein [Sinanaerobacter chloroacetimidivorans]|jgi:stage III sporulation protein AH|uniref:SpoIIIAH-like family protein n=1 Tax=Sinanaerobacter chloroacetimidivorans TaxID=2818044 RepID=A0A8J7VX20_9FIRM|nr:SpoIIIAH-like family protein [Sinanaerobacter chloroacetimidivorans]MBR0596624.1 SpoIIIAH-like family protein [Sinanaerobacter chloroacetimidivorans]
MEFTRRKKIILVGMLMLIACVGVLNNKLNNDQGLSASAGYEEYELEQMKAHDGDVLVDSLNLSTVPGTSTDSAVTEETAATGTGTTSESALDSSVIVTSDNYEELANADTYFEEVRATINMDRNQVISMLTDVIAETKDGPEKNNATQQKLKIIDYMNKEKVIENLIQNKGFADALVLMTDSSVNVTVNKQEITQSDVAKICDIVMRETGRSASQIVIQSKY